MNSTSLPAQSILLLTSTRNQAQPSHQRSCAEQYLIEHNALKKEHLQNNPDVLWIEEESSLGIETVRNLQSWIVEKPYSSDWKVAVLLHAETLTPEAQNALLKMLEEPPSFSYIVLVSSHEFALLPTIRSRCVKVLIDRGKSDHQVTSGAAAFVLPKTLAEAMSLAEHFASDRKEAISAFEQLLYTQKKLLETDIAYGHTQTYLETLTLAQDTLHLLKKNVNTRLAVEHFFLEYAAKNTRGGML